MKKIYLLTILLFLPFFCTSCGDSEETENQGNQSDTEAVDTDSDSNTDTDTDTDPDQTDTIPENCGDKIVDEGEVCDGGAKECAEVDPAFTGGYAVCEADCLGWNTTGCQGEDSADTTGIFAKGPYEVNLIDVAAGEDGAPREFRIYEPLGAEGNIPFVHFQHGFTYKDYYYDDMLVHLASHGFVVVSSQSNHGVMGVNGDTTSVEAEKVLNLINWLKTNLQSKLTVSVDFENIGLSGHSRGGKVSNRVLNLDPTIAKGFFGVDPVDSGSPVDNSDPLSLNEPVQFRGESFFLGTQYGPNGGSMACAPEGENSANFYRRYHAPSHHIIAAGVGHADMVDPDNLAGCGANCAVCQSSGNTTLNQMFISYAGGLMVAFFNMSLKGQTKYDLILHDASNHPFPTTLVEHKHEDEEEEEIEIGEPLGEAAMSNISEGYFFDGPGTDEAIIFYPGAQIDPTSYSSLMTLFAERGIDAFIVKMPADMALLGEDKADDIYKNYPNYKKYYLMGHSLGGTMISSYAAKHLDKTSGLFMLAAYPTSDLKNAQFPILYIYGSNDTVINKNRLENSLSLVPESAVVYEIEGGNHVYFGDLSTLPGDSNADITPMTQQKITVREILKLIR